MPTSEEKKRSLPKGQPLCMKTIKKVAMQLQPWQYKELCQEFITLYNHFQQHLRIISFLIRTICPSGIIWLIVGGNSRLWFWWYSLKICLFILPVILKFWGWHQPFGKTPLVGCVNLSGMGSGWKRKRQAFSLQRWVFPTKADIRFTERWDWQ